MTPEEALESLETFGGQSSVLQISADMGITRLRLLIHVQKRMDGERHRAEDRAERRELALAERLFSKLETSFKMRHLATLAATPAGENSVRRQQVRDAA
ncbi:MAG: hypothetical protein PSV46_15760 [Reyranella sp.]|nr:hypothetical protein [Reyranella sp.]